VDENRFVAVQQGRFSFRSAVVLLVLLLVTGIATAAASPGHDGGDVASVAKKRCKKAHKGAVVAKKRCKKKKLATPAPPVNPVTPPAAAPPNLAISPTSHNFGTVLGDSSDETFTVTNSGGSPSGTLTSSFAGTDPGNFVISTDTCNGTALGAGSTCTVEVHCSNPEFNGVTRTATLMVGGSPGGSPYATLTCFETT
jgi:hypothetical protein